MNYFILNINRKGESEVDYWINERNIAPIFYGESTIDSIRKNEEPKLKPLAYPDAKLFIDTFSDLKNTNVIFSIGDQYVYFYKQDGELTEFEIYKNDLVKGVKIEIIKKIRISECPLVLVTIKSNRYISAGTFRKLDGDKYLGNCNAINYLLTKQAITVETFDKYLQCLSSLEFETLVAKFLEECGFFVPAYKGGYIRNYDLFCKNNSGNPITINKILVNHNSTLSIQIKLNLKKESLKDYLDLYFCIWSDLKQENIVDWIKIKENLVSLTNTKKWLTQTLYWVIEPKY